MHEPEPRTLFVHNLRHVATCCASNAIKPAPHSHLRIAPAAAQARVRLHADGQEVQVHELRVGLGVRLKCCHGGAGDGPPRLVGGNEEGELLVAHHSRHVVVDHWRKVEDEGKDGEAGGKQRDGGGGSNGGGSWREEGFRPRIMLHGRTYHPEH